MLTFRASRTRPLSVGTLSGKFCRDQVLTEIRRGYGSGDLKRGQDRVVYVETPFDGDRIIVSDLADIQRQIAELEQATRGEKAYNAVFVGNPSQTAVSLAIYAALWEQHPDFRPRFYHVQNVATVETILGCTGLSQELTGIAG